MYGLTNMTLFLLTVNFLAALVAVQLLRGDFSADEDVNFANLYNAFLAVYQVFSSENWTDVLYGVSSAERLQGQTVVGVLFISLWLLFANCEYPLLDLHEIALIFSQSSSSRCSSLSSTRTSMLPRS